MLKRFMLFLFLFLSLDPAFGDSTHIKIGLFDLPPMAYIDSKGQIAGILPDIANALASETGRKFTYELLPWKRLTLYLNERKIDMAFGPFDVMRSDTDNLSVIYPVRYILLHRHDTEIESLHDLKRLNKSVGITQSAVTIKNILIKNKIGFYEINNYEQGIKMLAAGRLDAVLSSDIFAYSFLQSNNLAKVIAFPGYVYQKTNIWIVVSKKSPVNTELLRNDIKLGVEKLRKKGVIETILAKHSGKDWDK